MSGQRDRPTSRERTWRSLDAPWDLIVVGGGINGAGVLWSAARAGLRALLLEQRDVAWGTSSRSSQLVHGGLRYLAQGHVGLTRQAVRERGRLLQQLPELVQPVDFLLPFSGAATGLQLQAALRLYDALALRVRRHGVTPAELRALAPSLHAPAGQRALRYGEGRTDDAGLVLAVLDAARAAGAVVVTDAEVTAVRRRAGRVVGVRVVDRETRQAEDLASRVVVNATGVWSDRLRQQSGAAPRMRPVRGSHLLFGADRFPLSCGVVVRSPRDGRPVSVLPWHGATLVGTTDADHLGPVAEEPAITLDEVDYLLECLSGPFRSLALTAADVLSTWSGYRPLLASGAARSRDELRRHAVWDEHGLVTAAGGKLTTFQALARDVLRTAVPYLPGPSPSRRSPAPTRAWPESPSSGHEFVGGTSVTWEHVHRAVRDDTLRHLDDLMLRRTRLGLLLPRGGEDVLDRVRAVCADELGWDDRRWQQERDDYLRLVRACYAVPPGGTSTRSALGSTSTETGSGPTRSPSA